MERISRTTVETLTPADVDEVDLVLPDWAREVVLHVLPIDSGTTPDASSVDLLYRVGDDYVAVAGSSPTSCPENQDTTIARSNAPGVVRVQITNGATPPDGGVVLELWAARAGGV